MCECPCAKRCPGMKDQAQRRGGMCEIERGAVCVEREIGRGKGSHQQYSQVPTCTGFNYLIVMFRSGENPPINNVQCCHGNSGHRRKVTFVEKEHL